MGRHEAGFTRFHSFTGPREDLGSRGELTSRAVRTGRFLETQSSGEALILPSVARLTDRSNGATITSRFGLLSVHKPQSQT
jgi:hypothetical protein